MRRTMKLVHIGFLSANATQWKDRFEEVEVPVKSRRKNRFTVSVTPDDFEQHRDLIREAIEDSAKEFNA